MDKKRIGEFEHVFFIRHSNYQNYEKLMSDNKIGIHYNVDGNLTFNDLKARYPKGYIKTSLNYFDDLTKNGGLVFAKYNILSSGATVQKIKIGLIEKLTPVKSENYSFKKNGKEVVELVKTIKYFSLGEFSYSEAPVLSIYGGRSTLAKYNNTHPFYIILKESILLKRKIAGRKELIHPNCLEQLCVEWLRKFGTDRFGSNLNYCYTGVGSSFPIIDFAGRLENGRKIFAQVTFSKLSKIADKVTDLANYCSLESENFMVMFCDLDEITEGKGKVSFVDIKKVISDFVSFDGGSIINDFVGINDVDWSS